MKTKTITLTVDLWDTIQDAVAYYQDKGPSPNGWKSKELMLAGALLDEALQEAKEEDAV